MTETHTDPLQEFSGRGRLFPLPDSIIFPSVVQPLHVFESRYLEMLQDCLDDDKLVVMGTLKPGWESDYYSRPPVEPAACIGVIISHERQADGTYNLLLRGQARGRIQHELPPRKSYREVQIEIQRDQLDDWDAETITRYRQQLFEVCRPIFAQHQELLESLYNLTEGEMPLGQLIDLISHIVPLELPAKLNLLAESSVSHRTRQLVRDLKTISGPQIFRGPDPFPPDFSLN